MRRHLYLQIYAAFLSVAVLCAVVAALTMRATSDFEPNAYKDTVAELLAEALPVHSGAELDTRLGRLASRLSLHVVLTDPSGKLIAASHGAPVADLVEDPGTSWHSPARYAMRLRLPDGRTLHAVARDQSAHQHGSRFLVFLFGILIVAAIGCYPIAKRITRRVERLQRAVERMGAGDLSARVAVHGRDEVARLARAFNLALARIEGLVDAQRRVLASASHELRSPMARLRMAVELLGDDAESMDSATRAKLLRDATRDIEELDALVDDVLLSARLEGGVTLRPLIPVDLSALVADMAQGESITLALTPTLVRGDERLLRRVLRNLLENAERHGGGAEVHVALSAEGAQAVIAVCDRGPGVALVDRDRIFEPFYRPAGHREGVDGGVGLGLALVRQIARYHQGEVRYRQREGGGSCFEVRLPRLEEGL